MRLVPAAARRTTTTPNATMTTLASPTLGRASRSLWLVDMRPNVEGPDHTFADEVIWAITEGEADLRFNGESYALGAGDTAIIPGGAARRLTAGPQGFTAVVTTSAPGLVSRNDGSAPFTPDWVA